MRIEEYVYRDVSGVSIKNLQLTAGSIIYLSKLISSPSGNTVMILDNISLDNEIIEFLEDYSAKEITYKNKFYCKLVIFLPNELLQKLLENSVLCGVPEIFLFDIAENLDWEDVRLMDSGSLNPICLIKNKLSKMAISFDLKENSSEVYFSSDAYRTASVTEYIQKVCWLTLSESLS